MICGALTVHQSTGQIKIRAETEQEFKHLFDAQFVF